MSELFDVINYPKDPANKSDLEKKHYPTIDMPASVKAWEPFEVKVTIGKELAHPNEGAHFIQWVELYFNEVLISRSELTPTIYEMPVDFRLKLGKSGTLRARARCNLHGIWEGSAELKIN
ncbi:MAG: class II SORL domain-containing protein [bacterium]|nr:class II SORL domain-containing protein [bacterium]